MTNTAQLPKPSVIFIRGLPGSGKSYLAAALQQAIGIDNVILLDPDATDYESAVYKQHVANQTAEGVDPKLHAYRYLRAQAYDAVRAGKIIIWNQPFTNLEMFAKVTSRLQEYAAEQNIQLPMLVVEVIIDPAVASGRVASRKQEGGHGPSNGTFARFTREYTTAGDQSYTTLPVNGIDEVAISTASVLAALQNL